MSPGWWGSCDTVFGAAGEVRTGAPTEVRIGDSMLMISDGGGAREAMPAFLHVYIENADETYRRAHGGRGGVGRAASRHAVRGQARDGAGQLGQHLADRDMQR